MALLCQSVIDGIYTERDYNSFPLKTRVTKKPETGIIHHFNKD